MKVERDEKAAVRPANMGSVVIGVVIFVCSLFFVFYLVPNYIQEPPFLQNPMMSPRFLPGIVGWLTVIFSLLLAFDGVFGKPSIEQSSQEENAPLLRWGAMVVALAIYLLCFEALGAIIAGILATLILFIAHPIRTWWQYSLAFVLPILVAVIFINVMNVPLPLLFF
ncbi:putative tricarboxylic transport membrane protein [Halopseudomonas litoralis]|uniref:Putative tricarboxylic transport membrane protein n=2 Tax=Halopseudomonas litoralis TaxID=797277 RepID=A0A1H1X020_9GAMM|nr:putative tricarboxylic transport membrane protein [Halopseudomonas litoralis]